MDTLLTGHEVSVENVGPITIPPVDALLFNSLLYLTASEKDAKEFELNHPGFDTIYLEGYGKSKKYNSVMFLLFDILHKQDDKNSYPLHMMMSDLIATSKPTDLMDSLSRVGCCASPQSYLDFRNELADKVLTRKESGNVIGMIPE